MAMLGNSLIGISVLASLIGIGGFVDTRKVDRRYKTGYKNNEPDSRNLGRSSKILLCGIGLFLVGLAANRLLDPEMKQIQSAPSTTEASQPGTSVEDTVSANKAPRVNEIPSSVGKDASSRPAFNMPRPASMPLAMSGPDEGATGALPDRAAPAQTFATSFDCSRASHDDESAICHDAGLAAMDRRLAQLYSAAMNTISDPESLRHAESDWIIVRRQCGKDLDCLRRAYGERIGQFVGSLGSRPLLPAEGN
jgi:uncharacterized protein YecT (DUF1311 family)